MLTIRNDILKMIFILCKVCTYTIEITTTLQERYICNNCENRKNRYNYDNCMAPFMIMPKSNYNVIHDYIFKHNNNVPLRVFCSLV